MRDCAPVHAGLPRPLTRVIGREGELADLAELVPRSRLVTLTGAGGVGKTRLALAATAQLAEGFANGAIFVDLSAVTHATAVPSAVGRMLGIRDDGDPSLEQRLTTALREHELLLVLDNFEQVLPAATWLHALLQAAPGVRALVTSRAALRIRGEREFPVLPLAFPDPMHQQPIEQLLRYPALALFVERAQDVRTEFSLVEASAPSVAEICRRLDGLPLALELAAARMRVLSPEAILGRLNLALLSDGARDLPARQRTLEATIAWSFGLLNAQQQALFRRLAVFSGSFSLDAAQAVAVEAADGGSVLDLIASLAEINLLLPVEGVHGEPRFRMLETVREFALKQLEQNGDFEHARQQHAQFFARAATQAAAHLREGQRQDWLVRIDADMANFRSAMAWSGMGVDAGEALVRIAIGFGFYFWRMHGAANEGLRWGELALSQPAAAPHAERMRLLCEYGGIAAYLHKFGMACDWLNEALRLARAHNDDGVAGAALTYLGFVESNTGETTAAQHLHEGVTLLRRANNPHELLLGLNVATLPFQFAGDPQAARACLGESLASARQLGDDWAMAVALSDAGFLDIGEQNWASAAVHLEASLAIHQRLGDDGSVSMDYNNLAVVARNQGDGRRARELFEKSLAMERHMGVVSKMTLYNLGDLALRDGDLVRARAYLGEALRNSQSTGEQRAIHAALSGLARLAVAVGAFEVAGRLCAAADALAERVALPVRQEMRDAQERVVGVVRAELGVDRFRAIAAAGRSAPVLLVVEEALAWVESAGSAGAGQVIANGRLAAVGSTLSQREVEVLRLVAGGRSNREIAAHLSISLNTVARHVSNIFDKIGAGNRTEAAAYAHQQQLV